MRDGTDAFSKALASCAEASERCALEVCYSFELVRGDGSDWQGLVTWAEGAVGVVEETCEGMLASFCSSGQRQALLAFSICTAAPQVRRAAPDAEHT